MKDYCGLFRFSKDMNADQVFSITDVWLIIKFIWLLPAKIIMFLVHNSPKLSAFFEVDCSTGNSWGGGIFALFGWIVIIFVVGWILSVVNYERG